MIIRKLTKTTWILAAVSLMACNNDIEDTTQQQFDDNFKQAILGGENIDSRQEWKTTVKTVLNVSAGEAGTVKIYTENPIGNTVAALATQQVQAGSRTQLTVAHPYESKFLYAALYNEQDNIISQATVEASDSIDCVLEGRAKSKALNARRKAVVKGVTFPDTPAESAYINSVPTGVERYVVRDGAGTAYVDGSIKTVNYWGAWENGGFKRSKLYVTGDFKPESFYMQLGDIYICSGATFTLNTTDATRLQNGTHIYIAEGARLVTDGHLQLNSMNIYNRGTIDVPYLEANGTGVLYNQGIINIKNDLAVKNAHSCIVNEGTLNAENYGGEGSGSFYNVSGGMVTVRNTTTVNSNSDGWVNDGKFTTKTFVYNAGSINVWNDCQFTVTDQMTILLGANGTSSFHNDGGSSVIVDKLLMRGPSKIEMGANSIVKANTITMDCENANYGFYGPSTGYAVVQANEIIAGKPNQGYLATYGGNLYVASDKHFAQGYSGHYPYYVLQDNAQLVTGQQAAPISINTSECSIGYNPKKPAPQPKMYYYYAYEDLGTTDDFDFNDVVLRVSAPENGLSQVDVCAAGGTLPTVVSYKGIKIGGQDIHTVFGVSSATMVNTGVGPNVGIKNLGNIEVAGSDDVSNLDLSIIVKSKNVSREIHGSGKGETPLMIKVAGYTSGENAGKWFWPLERVNINEAFSSFAGWAKDINSNTNWYILPANDKVFKW